MILHLVILRKESAKFIQRNRLMSLLQKKDGFSGKKLKSQGGYRRVVPSPVPVGVINESIISDLARKGNIVIAAGGGGVPVYIDEKNDVSPAEAVIDKDLASSLLATQIGADEFYILTDVPYIYINYKKPDQEIKEFLNYKDTLKYLNEGQFAKGSMEPKLRPVLISSKTEEK